MGCIQITLGTQMLAEAYAQTCPCAAGMADSSLKQGGILIFPLDALLTPPFVSELQKREKTESKEGRRHTKFLSLLVCETRF